jgi:hypothetical protein
VDVETFSTMLASMEEGLALRWRAAPSLFEDGLASAAQILAKGALGLFIGLTVPAGDTTSLEEHAGDMFQLQPAPDEPG